MNDTATDLTTVTVSGARRVCSATATESALLNAAKAIAAWHNSEEADGEDRTGLAELVEILGAGKAYAD